MSSPALHTHHTHRLYCHYATAIMARPTERPPTALREQSPPARYSPRNCRGVRWTPAPPRGPITHRLHHHHEHCSHRLECGHHAHYLRHSAACLPAAHCPPIGIVPWHTMPERPERAPRDALASAASVHLIDKRPEGVFKFPRHSTACLLLLPPSPARGGGGQGVGFKNLRHSAACLLSTPALPYPGYA